jgi:hypothetical protein
VRPGDGQGCAGSQQRPALTSQHLRPPAGAQWSFPTKTISLLSLSVRGGCNSSPVVARLECNCRHQRSNPAEGGGVARPRGMWWLTRGLRVWWLRVARGSVGCYDVRAPSRFFSFAATGSVLRMGVQSLTGLSTTDGPWWETILLRRRENRGREIAGSDREGNFPAVRRPGTRRGQGEPGMTRFLRVQYARGDEYRPWAWAAPRSRVF